MKPLQAGLIGCGTIGRAIAAFLVREFPQRVRLAYLCEHQPGKAEALALALKIKPQRVSLKELVRRSDFIIEAASVKAAQQAVSLALRSHKQIMVMSAGGLLSDLRWRKTLEKSRGRLWVPSGAVAGLDGLLAARESGLRRVVLKTRKPSEALRGADYFRRRRFPALKGTKEYCVYRGSAAEAVRAFPQNVNVAAVLSLAGLGPRKTRVEIWTSRRTRENIHEIFIQSASGEIRLTLKNVPSPSNPKTSALAFYSARALLRRIFSNERIGT